jgi:thymidine kinase
MDFSSHELPTIDIIIGPMYAGKSSELIRRLNIYSEMGLKVLYINSILDTRTSTDFSTHNPVLRSIGKIESKKVDLLMNFMTEITTFDVIGIDEGQLFKDVKNFCITMTERYNKKIIVAGLNGDFKREIFGDILSLIPVCDNITKLFPFCYTCSTNKIIRPAPFTKRITEDIETIVIGDKATYIPVCRTCYLQK